MCAVSAAWVATLALALPAGASAAEPIILGTGVATGECAYCSEVRATITGPADGVAIEADNQIALSYQVLLNAPCMFNPQTESVDHCPPPAYSGLVAFGLAPQWFAPETDTFRWYAEREAGTCRAQWAPPETEPFEADGHACHFRQERCSAVHTFMLSATPVALSVACEPTKAKAARHHHKHRRHRR